MREVLRWSCLIVVIDQVRAKSRSAAESLLAEIEIDDADGQARGLRPRPPGSDRQSQRAAVQSMVASINWIRQASFKASRDMRNCIHIQRWQEGN